MSRPVTLFTGQWADLPFEEVCSLASQWGYDGLEIACWGDHLDAARGAVDDAYITDRKASTGHGDVPWEQCFRALNAVGYQGPISIEWEDGGMDRLRGAPDALNFVRGMLFDAPGAAFDAAFSAGREPTPAEH